MCKCKRCGFILQFVEKKPLDSKKKSSRAVHPLLAQIALHLIVHKIHFATLWSFPEISSSKCNIFNFSSLWTFPPPPLPSQQHQWTLPPLQSHHPGLSCPYLLPARIGSQAMTLLYEWYALQSMRTSKLNIVWLVPPVPTPAGQVMMCSSLEAATSYPHSSNTWHPAWRCIWRSLSPLLWRFRANLVPCQRFLHKAPEWDLPCPAVITFDIRITKLPNISRRDFPWPWNFSPCADGHWSSSLLGSGHVYCRSELSNKNKPFMEAG